MVTSKKASQKVRWFCIPFINSSSRALREEFQLSLPIWKVRFISPEHLPDLPQSQRILNWYIPKRANCKKVTILGDYGRR